MTSAGSTVYLDSSGLVKLVRQEAESAALERYLLQRPLQASCALARVEVVRAAWRDGPAAVARAIALIQQLSLVPLEDRLLDDAARLGTPALRTLDAIHLAAARSLGPIIGTLVTYDTRMIQAATDLGFIVDSPA